MKKLKLYTILFALFLVPGILIAKPIITNDAKTYAKKISNEVVRITNLDLQESDRQRLLKMLFKENVDTDFMGKFALGKYYKQLSAEQKVEYLKLYQQYVMYSYVPKFKDYASGEVEVVSAVKKQKGEYIVKTKIRPKIKNIKEIALDYRVKKYKKSFKINDIIGEGVSYITTQRSDFGGALSKINIDKFLEKLEKKVTKLKNKQS